MKNFMNRNVGEIPTRRHTPRERERQRRRKKKKTHTSFDKNHIFCDGE